jgi:nicotinamide mononucleotide transporter
VNSATLINRSLEILAVALNLLYTLYYLNGNSLCYLFGILGPLSLMVLCFRTQLYAEPVLQVFYIALAVYGFYNTPEVWQTTHWPFSAHLPLLIIGAAVSAISGFLLRKYTRAKLPYPDSVVTVFAMIGTWLMVNYVHESWLYLLAINALSVVIYLNRKLYVGAAMFVLYLIMSVDGYFKLNWFVL